MEWSWKSHEFSLAVNGGLFQGPPMVCSWIRGCDANDTAPSELVIGAGGVVLDRTDPGYVPGNGTLVVLARAYRSWSKLVTGQGAIRIAQLDFTLNIKSNAGLELPKIDTIKFGITEAADAKAQGSADATETTITILCTDIVRDGVHL